MELTKLAEEIARKAHEGQFRRDKKTPYIVHPALVAQKVAGDANAVAVAWLHDVLEDTFETAETLRKQGIPVNIIEAVELLTKNSSVSYKDYLDKVKTSSLATKVKVADMLSNLSDSPTKKQIIKYSKGFLHLLQ